MLMKTSITYSVPLTPAAARLWLASPFIRVFACLLLWACAGCAAWRAPRADLLRPAAAYGLRVLHVGSETSTAAGYALTETMAVTSAHLLADCWPVAAVEGAPMRAGNLPARLPIDRHAHPSPDDWVLLAAATPLFRPNRIDPDFRPQAGQTVLIGGFPLVGLRYTRRQFWDISPMVVEGQSLGERPYAGWRKGLYLIDVPSAAYNGFSGGPAACLDEDGRPVVWGTVVLQGFHLRFGEPLRYVLAIAPLPADLLPISFWRSYSR